MSFDFYMHEWTEADISAFSDCFAQIKLLAKDNNDEAKEKHKELVYGKFKVKKGESKIKPVYKKGVIDKGLNILDGLSIRKPSIDPEVLLPFSFFLQFAFTLAKPYLSKDDEQFYPCENPVRKDKVFKVPMVSASTWKGNMRWTARQINSLNPVEKDSPEIIRIFGNEKGRDIDFKRGRLNFYPTFFDQISLEVINPHDRKTKAGRQPIHIESVPEDATGIFSLLYVPFDLMGKSLKEARTQVVEDIALVRKAIKKMMLEYGFSAKKGSGFGIVKKEFPEEGVFRMNGFEEEKFKNFSQLKGKVEEIVKKLRQEI